MEVMDEPPAARGDEVMLPEDVLAEILRRLTLAASPRREALAQTGVLPIDSRRLLRAELLP
jgi:hypothetical protein|uniref:Uncharacterized protein n=1 Tax=Oryza rufipogon TaxID=4529 RepID=A0A0E0NZ07_ORYRU